MHHSYSALSVCGVSIKELIMKKPILTTVAATVASLGQYGIRAAGFVLEGMTAEKMRIAAIEGFNALVAEMREAGVKKIGDRRKCAGAADFHATIVAAGNTVGTANNYLTTFREAVESGKPITEWNSARAKAKAAKIKAAKQGRENPARDALVKLLNAEGGVYLLDILGIAFEETSPDAGQTFADIVIDYLKSEGEEITE